MKSSGSVSVTRSVTFPSVMTSVTGPVSVSFTVIFVRAGSPMKEYRAKRVPPSTLSSKKLSARLASFR